MIIQIHLRDGTEASRALHVPVDWFNEFAKRLGYTREEAVSHLAWIVKQEIETSLWSTRSDRTGETGDYGLRIWNPQTRDFEKSEPW